MDVATYTKLPKNSISPYESKDDEIYDDIIFVLTSYLCKNKMNKRITHYFFEFQNGFGAVREKG